jgi:hypothetical protein
MGSVRKRTAKFLKNLFFVVFAVDPPVSQILSRYEREMGLSTGSPAFRRGWSPRPILQADLRYLPRYWYHPSSRCHRFRFLVCYATMTNMCLLNYSWADTRCRCVFFLDCDVAGNEICCPWGINARGYAVYISQEYYGVCVKCVWSVSSCTAILPDFH